jgi:hypothetical protein
MAYRTILVELADDSGLEPRLQVARTLADHFDAVLIGMHVMPPLFIAGSYGEAAAYLGPDLIEAQRTANREIRERSRRGSGTSAAKGPSGRRLRVTGAISWLRPGARRT